MSVAHCSIGLKILGPLSFKIKVFSARPARGLAISLLVHDCVPVPHVERELSQSGFIAVKDLLKRQ